MSFTTYIFPRLYNIHIYNIDHVKSVSFLKNMQDMFYSLNTSIHKWNEKYHNRILQLRIECIAFCVDCSFYAQYKTLIFSENCYYKKLFQEIKHILQCTYKLCLNDIFGENIIFMCFCIFTVGNMTKIFHMPLWLDSSKLSINWRYKILISWCPHKLLRWFPIISLWYQGGLRLYLSLNKVVY